MDWGWAQSLKKLTELGCPQFFVATLEEAMALRQINQQTPVAVLGGLFTGAEDDYLAHDILPVLNTPDDITRWRKMAHSQNKKIIGHPPF